MAKETPKKPKGELAAKEKGVKEVEEVIDIWNPKMFQKLF